MNTSPHNSSAPIRLTYSRLFAIWIGALPVASGEPQRPWRKQAPALFWIGVLLWLLSNGLFVWTALVSADACKSGGKPVSLVIAQLLGPLLMASDFGCEAARTSLALAIDYALIACYTLLLAYPVTWVLQRRVNVAAAAGVALDGLTRKVYLFMWAFPVMDLLEDVFTAVALVPQVQLLPALGVAAASAGKFVSMGVLVWVLVRGLIRR